MCRKRNNFSSSEVLALSTPPKLHNQQLRQQRKEARIILKLPCLCLLKEVWIVLLLWTKIVGKFKTQVAGNQGGRQKSAKCGLMSHHQAILIFSPPKRPNSRRRVTLLAPAHFSCWTLNWLSLLSTFRKWKVLLLPSPLPSGGGGPHPPAGSR